MEKLGDFPVALDRPFADMIVCNLDWMLNLTSWLESDQGELKILTRTNEEGACLSGQLEWSRFAARQG